MSNTHKRIISAFVLIIALAICVYYGISSTLGFLLLASVIAVDEIYCNFLKRRRFDSQYIISQLVLLAPFLYFNFLDRVPDLFSFFINAALLMNLFNLVYLFSSAPNSDLMKRLFLRLPVISGIFILLPVMSLASLFHYIKWQEIITVLIVVNFGMDTGAWLFGKMFGKRKLWPAVSPNKTVEGLIGGIITSGSLGVLVWWIFFDQFSWLLVVVFCVLGLISQLGDLVQSKIKRQFDIKDSSSLIPGHGGVYDRIDSLVFVSPFFAATIKYFYF